jgi:hypothetical protein
VKSPTKKRKSSVKKSEKKISARRKMRKIRNGKALMRVPKRKRTRIDWSRTRKSMNRKGNG